MSRKKAYFYAFCFFIISFAQLTIEKNKNTKPNNPNTKHIIIDIRGTPSLESLSEKDENHIITSKDTIMVPIMKKLTIVIMETCLSFLKLFLFIFIIFFIKLFFVFHLTIYLIVNVP